MKRITPAELAQFLSIAQHRSFSRAAIELGVSPSALSHSLRGLEEQLGLRLLNRTTRSVGLTEAGERLLSRIAPAFRDIDDALEDLNHFRGKPSGSLRINAGRSATQLVLLPLVARFLKLYPEIRVEIDDNDALVDVVSSGFDAGVRFGERIEADMVAIPLGRSMRSVVVATPAFLAEHGVPAHPHDLPGLPCIRHRFPSGVLYRWELERDGIKLETQVDGPLTLHDVRMMVDAALHGAGLAFVFEHMAAEHVASGRLVQVLEDWCPHYPGLYLYYPSRRQVPAALKAFIEFVQASR
ncbi:LysR family transcriptional regulator [Janthinobacterium agaricidamnosum]|uniref:Bacterial regulatory helix-turn-helix, lysR family protein n=1 Tax=Janthinobacterium agaricidamnosum NBRC 102515 = DSM 9628 TaxID=1349767 RepID=W0VDL0_9BURK|nr:LysR family transcriptional regulator [Janthinobacterium agaricidamnosum]CDG85996.1 bacterial regulatory helix-turn-helix, lysR family protein [Janthinobacterium agaricidamnosum NBRC 102515 = DSM 9628]